jgi:hypothetical protein
MQPTARRLSVVSATSFARRRLIRDVRLTNKHNSPKRPSPPLPHKYHMSVSTKHRCIAMTIVSALAGYVCAWLLWQFIYGIGDRVVTDRIHNSMEGSISLCGLVAGSVYGLIGLSAGQYTWSRLFVSHCAALAFGCVAANFGWAHGVWIYFISLQILFVIGRLSLRKRASQLSVNDITT